jgi:hypothetical protein
MAGGDDVVLRHLLFADAPQPYAYCHGYSPSGTL